MRYADTTPSELNTGQPYQAADGTIYTGIFNNAAWSLPDLAAIGVLEIRSDANPDPYTLQKSGVVGLTVENDGTIDYVREELTWEQIPPQVYEVDINALAAQLTSTAEQNAPMVLGTTYVAGDTVLEDHSTWVCTRELYYSNPNWTIFDLTGHFTREASSEWENGVSYLIDDEVGYQGTQYVCIQAHTSQVGWEPPNVPALWSAI